MSPAEDNASTGTSGVSNAKRAATSRSKLRIELGTGSSSTTSGSGLAIPT